MVRGHGTDGFAICNSSCCNAGGWPTLPDAREERRAEAEAAFDRWSLVPDGAEWDKDISLVMPVRQDGVPLILKIPDPKDDEAHGALVLQHYAGKGAVRLIASQGHVQLLERLDRDGALVRMVIDGQDDAATRIICDVLAQLHRVPGQWPELLRMEDRRRTLVRRLAGGDFPAEDRSLMARAVAVAEEMGADRSGWQALHGDMHHTNIMASADRGWVAIDPKGIFGPRAYDFANTLFNPYPLREITCDPARMSRQVDVMVERAGLDRVELLAWSLVHVAQATSWSDTDWDYGIECLRTVAAIS